LAAARAVAIRAAHYEGGDLAALLRRELPFV